MMKSQNFHLNDEWKKIERDLITKLFVILENNNVNPDLWIESLCFREQFSNETTDEYYFNKIVRLQNEDGG